MSDLLAVIPKVPIHIRVATMADFSFIDALQKKHPKGLGYFPRKQLEGYLEAGNVLVAEEVRSCQLVVDSKAGCPLPTNNYQLSTPLRPLGYIIYKDRYLKRDELGVVFQLCVADSGKRKLIGATLVKAAFERSAYGCRLFCLWCAQDLEANRFWEAMGFVPIAFRAGSDRKRRVHIFWQKKIRAEGEQGQGGWWFPSKTEGGAIRADRLVFPIPPGTHWSEIKAVELPREKQEVPALEHRAHGLKTRATRKVPAPTPTTRPAPGMVGILVSGKIKYVPRPGYAGGAPTEPPAVASLVPLSSGGEKKRRKRVPEKIDPKFLAATRELRDRYLEQINAPSGAGMLPESRGKYDVTSQRHLSAAAGRGEIPLLPAA